MAKELPYFKFFPAEWISGEITLEDLQAQGVFINICAYYWFKSGKLTLSEIKRRVKCKQAVFDRLIENNLIKIVDDSIEISFLRAQLDERGHISERNSRNGSLGGAPKGNKNAQKNNPKQPKTTNKEKEKEKEEEKNKKRKEDSGAQNQDEIFELMFADERWAIPFRKNFEGKNIPEGWRECYLYHTQSPNPPTTTWEWRQKLNTWMINKKTDQHQYNGQPTSTNKHQQHTASLVQNFTETYGPVLTGGPTGQSQ
jgi:ribosomal protein L12E/L44/L45/RPP1/RPP2